MPYEKREWIAKVTPLSAANFNHMENGIEAAANAAAENAKNHSDFKSEMATQIDALEEQVNAAEVRDAEFAQQSNEKHAAFNVRLAAVEQEVTKIPPVATEPYQQLVTDAGGTAKWVDGGYVKVRITTDDIVWDKSSSTPGTSKSAFVNGVGGRYIKVSEHVPLKEDALSSDAVWDAVNPDISYDFDGAYGIGPYTYVVTCAFTPDGKIPSCMVVAKPFKFYIDSNEVEYFDFWEPGIYMFAKSSTSTHNGKLSCLCNVPMSEVAVPFIQTASVGQTIVVKSVDENGKPTAWEAVDGGGSGVANLIPFSYGETTEDDEVSDFEYIETDTLCYYPLPRLSEEDVAKILNGDFDTTFLVDEVGNRYIKMQGGSEYALFERIKFTYNCDAFRSVPLNSRSAYIEKTTIKVFLSGDDVGKLIMAATIDIIWESNLPQ